MPNSTTVYQSTEQRFLFPFAMTLFAAVLKEKNRLHLQTPFTQINVDKIACTVSSLRGIQILTAVQKHREYGSVLDHSANA